MKRPINKLKYAREAEESLEESQQLAELNKILQLNAKAQLKLKKVRDDIMNRMQNLEEYISTYRLKSEYPPANEIISYIKFERNTPSSYREQSRVIEQQEAIKTTTEDDCLFIKKLIEEKPSKKKKDINFADLPRNPRLIKFAELAQASSFKTGIEVYKAWLEYHKVKTPKKPFDKAEEELVIEKQRIYGDNWEKVCQFVEQRTFQQVYYEFHNRINPKMITGRWTSRQSLMLVVLLEHYGVRKWAQISQKMGVKSELQVRERFCNILDPNVGKNTWTRQLEAKLMEVAGEYNYSWKDIAKLAPFRNKTDNCIWRKFRNLIIRKSVEEITDEINLSGKKELTEKILKFKAETESKKKGQQSQQVEAMQEWDSSDKDEQQYIVYPSPT